MDVVPIALAGVALAAGFVYAAAAVGDTIVWAYRRIR